MLTTITDLLTALVQLLKQKHLVSTDYQQHLLFERLEKGISDDIDRVKEIALACGYSEDIADAQQSLAKATDILAEDSDVLSIIQKIIREIDKIIDTLNRNAGEDIEGTFNQYKAKEAIINMLGDIAEKRVRDIYLLRFVK